jgi:hypothetical protein
MMVSKFMDPKNQFLMQMGAGLLGQPYTKAPQNAFTGMQTAFSQGTNAYQNALLLQQGQEDRQDIKDKELEEFNRQNMTRTKFQSSLKGLPLETQRSLMAGFDIDKPTAWKSAMALQHPTRPKLDTSNYMKDAAFALYGKPTSEIIDPDQQAAVAKRARELRLLENPPPADPFADPWISAAAARGTKFMDTVDVEAQGAIEKMSTLQVMQSLNETITSGSAGAPAYAQLQGLAKDFMGWDISINDPAAAKETYDALSVELMRQERKHGPRDARFTDKDAEFYIKSVSGMKNVPDARKLILEVVMGREQAKLDRQMFMVNKEQEYLAQGMKAGEAMQKATADTKAYDRNQAQNKQGLFINEATGQLTPLGAEMQRVTGQIPGQAGAQPLPPGFRGIIGPNGEPGRMSPEGTPEKFNEQTGQWEPF